VKMMPRDAAAIVTATTGRKTWCEGVDGAWYLTWDREDNTSGYTYDTVADAVRDVVRVSGFVLFPDTDDWPDARRLAILPECHPGAGYLLRLELKE